MLCSTLVDDFAISPIGPRERADLLEVLDDRVGLRATLITSQLPLEHWHDYIGEPTLADAILDRLLHLAHKIHLEGESMRKRAAAESEKSCRQGQEELTQPDRSE
jgi:DNA replication protein DnaC